MALVGNKHGPRKSEIISFLGAGYFGLSQHELVLAEADEEQRSERGIIDPVHIDDEGRPYLVFSTANGTLKRFLLDQAPFFLKGDIATYTDEEQERWKKNQSHH